jgi:hypothetical protein
MTTYIITFSNKPSIKLNNITSFLSFKCGSTGVLLDVLSITMEESNDSSNKQVFEYIED